jgi:hypothetical protein
MHRSVRTQFCEAGGTEATATVNTAVPGAYSVKNVPLWSNQ